MENKFNDNELDRWLRENSEARDVAPESDGWDQPSEAVWTGLRAGLDERKKRRRGFILLWSVLLLGLVGGIGFWQFGQTENLPERTEKNALRTEVSPSSRTSPEQSAALSNIPAEQKSDVLTTSPPGKTSHQIQSPAKTVTPDKLQAEIQTNKQTNTTLNTAGFSQKNKTGYSQTNAPLNHQPPPETKQLIPENTNESAPTSAVELATAGQPDNETTQPSKTSDQINWGNNPGIPVLPVVYPELKSTRQLPVPERVDIVPVERKTESQFKPGFYAGIVSGNFYTSRILDKPDDMAPNGRESGAWTWQQGLNLGFQLNRHWALETGLQRTGIRLQAERTIAFQYRTDREAFNHARYLYQSSTDQQIQTSFGEVEMRMDMGREPSRPISDQAKINVVLRTDEQVRYLRIPLALRFNAGNGPWQFNVGAGIAANIEAGYDLQLTAARANRPGVRNISARVQNRINGLAPVMMDVHFNAGLQYRITRHWAVQLAPEFRYGLSSMYRNGPFRSLAVSGGIQLGAMYSF